MTRRDLHFRTSHAALCGLVFSLVVLGAGSGARADGPRLTGDLQLGGGLPIAGHLGPPGHYDDHARVGLSGFGDVALSLSDLVAIEVVMGLGYLFELDGQNDDNGSIVGLASIGPKLRFLDSRRLSASMHIGYYHLDGHQAGLDLGLGYDLGLAETWDVGVFVRYALTVRGTATTQRDQHFDALLMAGVGIRFGRLHEAEDVVAEEAEPEPEPALVASTEPQPVVPVPVEPEEPEAPVVVAEPVAPEEPPSRAPMAEATVATVGTHAPYVVLFAYGDDSIRDSGVIELRRLARWLRAHPEATHLRIVGHTDPRGDDEHNARLSVNRARTVRDWLVHAGFASSRFEISGVGSSEPLVPNASTESEQRRNRRVEVIVAE